VTGIRKAFDPGTVLLAKHAQHVVLVHFPIALFFTGVAFDWAGRWTKRAALAEAGYYNLLIAAASTLPVIATGLLAWQLQLEGQRPRGILLLHLVMGCASNALICAAWWLRFRARQHGTALLSYVRAVDCMAVAVLGLTGHLGGFLSGVSNG
jgi:uncharacterized membrane protein